ncbi:MAG: YihY/virulence factor BrkB family protein [Eubacteriales bacterium]|nr:YihY/virulence factor BrkB family protein [Eubacteriales bacterium]
MREFPKGGLIGKAVHLGQAVARMRVPLYAANASFFIVLAVFPALLLVVGALQYTSLEVERMGELLQGILPEAFLEGAEELILLTYDNMNGVTLGLSAVTALWSASRGVFGILTGLNAIYDVGESRGYLYTRFISVAYTFAFLVVLVLTLALHVFGTGLLELLTRTTHPFWQFLLEFINLRFFLLLILQTGFFTAMFMTLPNRRNRFRDSLPGALLASMGWLVFSDLFSIYVEHFAKLSNVFGSVYAVSLSMLWLYFCMSIVFYGGALNAALMKWGEK